MDLYEHYQSLAEQFRTLNDQALIEMLSALPVLPDEDDLIWNEDAIWIEHANIYSALLDVASERKLIETIPLFLERACYGDPHEMMRSIRHSFEQMVKPDWDVLSQICLKLLAQNPPAGARLWTITQLSILEESSTLDPVFQALTDPAPLVREAAIAWLWRIADTNPSHRPRAIQALEQAIASYDDQREQRSALAELEEIKAMQ